MPDDHWTFDSFLSVSQVHAMLALINDHVTVEEKVHRMFAVATDEMRRPVIAQLRWRTKLKIGSVRVNDSVRTEAPITWSEIIQVQPA